MFKKSHNKTVFSTRFDMSKFRESPRQNIYEDKKRYNNKDNIIYYYHCMMTYMYHNKRPVGLIAPPFKISLLAAET